MDQPVNLSEFEELAQARLPRMVYDYYASGAQDEVTLRENSAAFQRIALRYRVLAGVGQRDARTRVLDQDVSFPVLLAPTAFQRLANDEGELATARAAGAAGTIMILSTMSTVDVEEVVPAAGGAVWFQLYVYKDRAATEALVRRAEAAGCKALVLTVDAPVLGRRERDVRNRFHLPQGIEVKNMHAAGYGELGKDAGGSGLAAYFASLIDHDLDWDDLAWLRSITSLPVLIKGVVRGDDAARAVEAGVAGVVVSNHGGRQLDTAPATVAVLPEVVEAVNGRAAVLLDGGVRRGTCVIKALALGADAVLIGRPVLWGLAAQGQEGVTEVLEMLRAEVDEAMALCGCKDVAAITRDLIA